jgi:hypothetical protein
MTIGRYLIKVERSIGFRIATHTDRFLVKKRDYGRRSEGKNRFVCARLPLHGLRSGRNIDFSYTKSSICALPPLGVGTTKNMDLVFVTHCAGARSKRNVFLLQIYTYVLRLCQFLYASMFTAVNADSVLLENGPESSD